MVAQLFERVLHRALVLILEPALPRRANQIIGGGNRSIARISSRDSYHPIDVLLDVFNEPFDNVDLTRASFD